MYVYIFFSPHNGIIIVNAYILLCSSPHLLMIILIYNKIIIIITGLLNWDVNKQ
jgi:hypothetical protein